MYKKRKQGRMGDGLLSRGRRRGISLSGLEKKEEKKTYNSRYSLVVTHPTTNLPI
jgi:hypothetical protein